MLFAPGRHAAPEELGTIIDSNLFGTAALGDGQNAQRAPIRQPSCMESIAQL